MYYDLYQFDLIDILRLFDLHTGMATCQYGGQILQNLKIRYDNNLNIL